MEHVECSLEEIIPGVVQLVQKAETDLPGDVEEALRMAHAHEHGVARTQLDILLKNCELARETKRPLCQDTGVQTFFVSVGDKFPFWSQLQHLIVAGVQRATKDIPLRPNAIQIISGKNTGDNTGRNLPRIYWQQVEGTQATITALPRGGGGENMTRVALLKPSNGLEGAVEFAVSSVLEAGGKPCPPVVVGVGIGGDADLCVQLGKQALLRKLGNHHGNPVIARLEETIVQRCNEQGVGPMGLGGNTTVLDAHVELAERHPAMFPVGVVISCWALRRASMIINDDGSWEVE